MSVPVRQSFVSVIGVMQSQREVRQLSAWFTGLYSELSQHFSHFEFVLVNNGTDLETIETAIQPLAEDLRKNIFLLNLSAPVNRDNAILAGLDRANGDYTVVFEFDFVPRFALKLGTFRAE
jgi:hypothetical protein